MRYFSSFPQGLCLYHIWTASHLVCLAQGTHAHHKVLLQRCSPCSGTTLVRVIGFTLFIFQGSFRYALSPSSRQTFLALESSLLPPPAPLAKLPCLTTAQTPAARLQAPRRHCTRALEGHFNWIRLYKAELAPWASPAPPNKGASHPPLPGRLPGLGTGTMAAPPPCPRAWPLAVHRPSSTPMGDDSHSTALPSRTKDLLHLQSCPAFNFFLILLARRDTLQL